MILFVPLYLLAAGWTSDMLGAVSPVAILQMEQLDACMHMRFRCACGSWKLHVYLIYTRDAGLEVEVEGEGLGDFRMPGLVGGTVVPTSSLPLWLLEARLHVSVGRPERVCTHTWLFDGVALDCPCVRRLSLPGCGAVSDSCTVHC